MEITETPLCKIAFKYGTDKCPKIRHSYTPFYYELFSGRQDKIKKLLEIGIGYKSPDPRKQYQGYQIGGGLMMWRDFFPNAQIYGTDIRKDTLITGERLHTYLCDQYNAEQMGKLIKEIGSDIDIVVDDGSHKHEHQVWTCQFLMPLLKKDVLYIIEDVLYTDTIVKRLSNFNIMTVNFPIRQPNRWSQKTDDVIIIVKNK